MAVGRRGITDTWFATRHQRWTGRRVLEKLGTDRSGLTDGQVSWGAAEGQDSETGISDSPALIPAVSWMAAEAAAGGSPWGL